MIGGQLARTGAGGRKDAHRVRLRARVLDRANWRILLAARVCKVGEADLLLTIIEIVLAVSMDIGLGYANSKLVV